MESFHNAMLNDYIFNFLTNPDSGVMIQHVYSTENTVTDKHQIITTEFFPETELQRKSMEEFSSRHLTDIAKNAKPDYVVAIDMRYDDNNLYICSIASSNDGEIKIKGLEVITKANGEIEFKETDRFNSEYIYKNMHRPRGTK